MPIRVLCIGDPHFTEDSVREMDLFIDKTLTLIDKLLAEPEGLHLVVDLGDTLDRHEKVHLTPFTQATRFLHEISLRVPLVILIGNHDLINNTAFLTDESPFFACNWWPNTTVVDKTKSIEIKGSEKEIFRFTCVPYVYPGRFIEALNKCPDWKSSNCIFAHQEIRGCSLGIIKSTLGDPWLEDYPLLISGHIHEYEKLNKNVIYTGTPRMKTFGDKRKKTVSVFTFNKTRENTDTVFTWIEERIDLGLPKKTSLHVSINQLISTTSFLSITEDLTGTLKIFVEGTSSELSIGMKNPILKHLKSIGVKIIPKVIDSSDSHTKSKTIGKEDEDKDFIRESSISDLQSSIWKKLEQKTHLLSLLKALFLKKGIKIRLQNN